jgi:hypothetical protein
VRPNVYGTVERLVELMEREFEIKRKIFEKVAPRMRALSEVVQADRSCCHELNPDVIVISGDQTMLFEPRNRRALEWLHQRYGMNPEGNTKHDAVRVHPSVSQKTIDELKAAGFKVSF